MSSTSKAAANRLANELSPYLVQHAYNPVDWFPWGEEALARAHEEDKLILLSIGYSACHWCHVMAHESFEDEKTASVMNQLFINIKVDREQRPDLDRIYQFAHQVLTQKGGGWPLTMILTPDDQVPFFAGTYFPKDAQNDMPSFSDVMLRVEKLYRSRQQDVRVQNASLLEILQQASGASGDASLVAKEFIKTAPLDEAKRQLEDSYDDLYAGFGKAPKFPHPTNIERLLRHWSATRKSPQDDKKALDMAISTLQGMALGGIYDHIGGGFCRYSVDQQWTIPHFEKMLYDNGPLLALYADAWTIEHDDLFEHATLETADWVMREMQSNDGAYFSTQDADTDGEEGKFYVWYPDELKEILDAEEFKLINRYYGLDGASNFEGKWHLYVTCSLEQAAEKTAIDVALAPNLLASAKQKIFRERNLRYKLVRDEKILTSWNGLMIKGMAVAARRFARDDLTDSAVLAYQFVKQHLWREQRLLATHKNGQSQFKAYLDDYVFLLDGVLELLQTRWDSELLQFAIQICDAVIENFEDHKQGGFFFTANDHEVLIQRPKPYLDDAIPSGNGIAAYAIQRLGYLLAEPRYLDVAERTIRAAWESIERIPYANNAMLLAVEEYLYPTQVVIIRGSKEDVEDWSSACHQFYVPRSMVFAICNDVKDLPISIQEKPATEKPLAYLCEGRTCSAPINDLDKLLAKLQG